MKVYLLVIPFKHLEIGMLLILIANRLEIYKFGRHIRDRVAYFNVRKPEGCLFGSGKIGNKVVVVGNKMAARLQILASRWQQVCKSWLPAGNKVADT
jgi:hypothetical protein